MGVANKYVIPVVVVAGCLVLIGEWKFSRSDSSETNERAESLASDGVQRVEFGESKPDIVALAVAASAGSTSPFVPTSPSGYEAPGTLNDQVGRALAAKDGPMAANLAFMLKECEINMGILEVASSEGANPHTDQELLAMRLARLRQYEREFAACQTVPGDHKQVRLRLLDLAVQQGVVGAARESFSMGSREPATLSQLIRDANAGDRYSLLNVARYDRKLLGITRDEQDAVRYALKLGAADPETGFRVVNSLRIAEEYAVPDSHFDFSEISNEARMKGAEIAERLKLRLRENMS
ncbi:hypothetical protein ACNI65_06075 [Roseateles sp. So40a]|uniref:hypothetical protein n=1 Tax=Roseateles sp. So40a TaxID=3400226 RepID=UPI003A8BA15A